MSSVAAAIRQHAPAYLQQFGDRVPLGHRRVIDAITRCRTGELGHTVYHCDHCDREHWVGRSCGNRHCATCQADKTAEWLAKQAQRLLPVQHFLVTFTVPEELRPTLRAHQQAGYDALFAAGSETIRKLLAGRWLGTSKVGFFGVLHTWGRDPMVYHPHVHFVVPGGGVSEDGAKWLATPTNFLFPEACAAVIYRAKLCEALQNAGLLKDVPRDIWQRRWQVDVQPVGDGQAVLKYLAPYVYRVAISDRRIVHVDEHSVTFRYTPSKSKQEKRRTVDGHEFVRGFLQHVLPRGFQKVRHYGWMNGHRRVTLDSVRWLVWLFLGWTYWLGSGHAAPDPIPKTGPRCARCGKPIRLVYRVEPRSTAFTEHAPAYRDTG